MLWAYCEYVLRAASLTLLYRTQVFRKDVYYPHLLFSIYTNKIYWNSSDLSLINDAYTANAIDATKKRDTPLASRLHVQILNRVQSELATL